MRTIVIIDAGLIRRGQAGGCNFAQCFRAVDIEYRSGCCANANVAAKIVFAGISILIDAIGSSWRSSIGGIKVQSVSVSNGSGGQIIESDELTVSVCYSSCRCLTSEGDLAIYFSHRARRMASVTVDSQTLF